MIVWVSKVIISLVSVTWRNVVCLAVALVRALLTSLGANASVTLPEEPVENMSSETPHSCRLPFFILEVGSFIPYLG